MSNRQNWSRLLILVAFLMLLAGLVYAMYTYMGIGADWHYYFYAKAREYLAGETRLYDVRPQGIYNPPWLIAIMFPFALLPEREGLLLYRLAALAMTVFAVFMFAPRKNFRQTTIILILVSPMVWDSLIAGNMDPVALLGIVLTYRALQSRNGYMLGLAIPLAAMKPQLFVIPAMVLLPGLRFWPRKHLWLAAAIIAAFLVASFAISGLDWPLRYWRVGQQYAAFEMYGPYNISLSGSLAKAASAIGVEAWLVYVAPSVISMGVLWLCSRTKDAQDRLALAVTASPLTLPYTTAQSLIVLMVIAWPRLVERSRYLVATAVYSTQFLVVLRGTLGWDFGWILILFPISLALALVLPPRFIRGQIV